MQKWEYKVSTQQSALFICDPFCGQFNIRSHIGGDVAKRNPCKPLSYY